MRVCASGHNNNISYLDGKLFIPNGNFPRLYTILEFIDEDLGTLSREFWEGALKHLIQFMGEVENFYGVVASRLL